MQCVIGITGYKKRRSRKEELNAWLHCAVHEYIFVQMNIAQRFGVI